MSILTIILVIITILLVLYGIIVTIGMLKGMKKIEFYENVIENIKLKILNSYTQMKEVDTLGAFEADDDVGNVFKDIKSIIDDLNININTENTENINE